MTRRALSVEFLEDRTTPVVWNNPWPDPGHLTLSFAPDGTDVQGSPSTLFAELGPAGANWQTEILRAFQAWAAQTNINLSLASDGTATPFGSPGPVQGGTEHGDIRIGATALGPDELAISTPFDLFGGWGGTVASIVADEGFELLDAPVRRVAGANVPLPFADVLEQQVIPTVDAVIAAVRTLTAY